MSLLEQSRHLMCAAKHHKSERHSSVFLPWQSESVRGWKSWHLFLHSPPLFPLRQQNGSYLASDSSDFCLIYQALRCAAKLWATEIFHTYNTLFSSLFFIPPRRLRVSFAPPPPTKKVQWGQHIALLFYVNDQQNYLWYFYCIWLLIDSCLICW